VPSLASRQHIRAERSRYKRAQKGQAWSVKDLPKYYYHRNFCEIIETVSTNLVHLLDETSQEFIRDFLSLPFAAQCTYVRMSARKAHVFNAEKFIYSEIENLHQQFEILAEANFITPVNPSICWDFFAALTKPELIKLLSNAEPKPRFKKSWKKDQLIDVAINDIDFESLTIPPIYWVQSRTPELGYIFYLHSGQIDGHMQSQTLRDLGLIKSPKADRLFGAQFDSIESARTAFFYAAALHDFRNENTIELDILEETVADWPDPICPMSTRLRDKLLHKLGGLCEQRGNIDAALGLYTRADSVLCNERVIRLRYKKGEKDWVKNRLEDMIENPSSDSEHNFAQDFYARKYNKKRTSTVTDLLRKSEQIALDEAFKNQPEKAAMQYFTDQGLVCFRTENTPWRNLFGLLFWDELFGNTQDIRFPKALHAGEFYFLHKTSIERKLAELDTPELVIIQLLKTLTTHYGTYQKIIHWRPNALDRIRALIETSPKGAIAHILRLMSKNWDDTKDGFPDLMIVENDICHFVEIKATGDVIRRNQLTRLKQLRGAGFDAKIVQVTWKVDPNQTYIVVDVETTGGRPGLHRVTEIGAVKVKGGKIIDEWSSLINPQRSIPPNITRITGITQEMVANAPVFAEVVESFTAFMGDAIFAAHNVNFDYGFMSAEHQMVDRRFRHPKICTCASMRKLYPGHASYSLKNLCRDFEIELNNHHRALCDAKAAAELLFLINEKRIETDR